MTLCEYPEATSYGAQVTVRLNGLTPGKAVYYGSEALLGLEPGNTVTCDVSFGSARSVRGEEIRSFTAKGVFLLCYRRGEETVETGSAGSLRWLPQRTARAMAERIDEIFSQDSAPFLTAILTGDRSGIPQKAGDDLSEVGLYHLLAISGMHCAYLMELLYLVLGRHRRRLTAFLGLPLLLFYALLSGASPSVRALVSVTFSPSRRRRSQRPWPPESSTRRRRAATAAVSAGSRYWKWTVTSPPQTMPRLAASPGVKR